METALIALAVVGFVAGMVYLLVWVNNRDRKRDAARNKDTEANYPRI